MSSSADEVQLSRVIRELKEHIGINWKAVARELQFTTTDIDAIVVRDEHDLKEQIHRFFEEWNMREGRGASADKLVEAVRAAGLQNILNDLQRAIPELECGGRSIKPVEETSRDAAAPTSERDIIRMKRLQKLLTSNDPNDPSSSPPEPSLSPSGRPRRSASTPDTSPTTSELTRKNSEPAPHISNSGASFEVGQMVKVDHTPKPWHGVVKYLGPVTDCKGTFAGLEMDEVVEGGHSGKFLGKRYFTCDDGYGLMLPLSRLKLDDRFDPPSLKGGGSSTPGEDHEVERDKHMPSSPPTTPSTSSKPSDPFSLDFLKGATAAAAAVPDISEKYMPGVFESIDGSETSDGDEFGVFGFQCPGDVAGFVIGRDGKNRRDVESKTGTSIRVEKRESDKAANTKVIIIGKKANCQRALVLIAENIRRKRALHTATTETIEIPSQHIGRVIGTKGANIKAIENLTVTRIKIEPPTLDTFLLGVAKCEITGSAEQIEKAKEMVMKSVEGTNIAEAANIAAFMLKFIKELKAEGYSFSDKD